MLSIKSSDISLSPSSGLTQPQRLYGLSDKIMHWVLLLTGFLLAPEPAQSGKKWGGGMKQKCLLCSHDCCNQAFSVLWVQMLGSWVFLL